jgi:hypothetical protein
MPIIHRVEQGTVDWHRVRLGIPTASQFHRIITPKEGKFSKQARPYMYRLVAERMLSQAFEDDLERVEWIEKGAINEPRAARAFMDRFKITLDRVGFITDNHARWGCSPDALTIAHSKAAIVEIKCPQPWTQMGRLLDGMDEKYRPQVQGQLYIAELDRAHFFSWHEQMPAFHVLTERDEEYIARLADALLQFNAELIKQTNHARKMGVYLPTPIGPAQGSGMGS